MDAAAPLPQLAATLPAGSGWRQRRFSLRAIGLLGILALIALATLMVVSALLFRGAVQAQLQQLEDASARHGLLQQWRQEAQQRSDSDAATLQALDTELRDTAAERQRHLATTRHYIDGSTVTIASLAWLGITSMGSLALLFFSRLAGDIAAVRARAQDILMGDRGPGAPLSRHDELGELSQAVNDLAGALARHERDLAVERRHVMHQEKLATIGSMAAGVIREIGNPIAAIDGYARALLEARLASPGPPPVTGDEDVKPILRETARLIAITREISNLAAGPAAQWQLASVNQIVTHTLALLRYEPRLDGVTVTTTLDPQLPAAMAFADRLMQMLTNLVVNAADATAGLAPHTARIAISTRPDEGGILLVVDDNGCGMPPEVVVRAFEPLFTTKPAGRGTGLGLPLCRSVVQAHGGRISLALRPGGGTRVTVWLPLDGDEPVNCGNEFHAADPGHRR
ncbi:ATP-binding protein [Ramlibacter sp.]|uniref:sensor histidine kinase n=1 Tax=Ramlibacter sp. TaxID=1917967 RepID=UPI00262162BD|nr:ATP-binding protein [Ramlibacter sp.]MDB5953716.1 hypothetical protein [Ramlibacter sp.]